MEEMRDWSALPAEAIELISTHLTNAVDYVRFRSVCTTWRSPAPKRPQLPWLVKDYFDQSRNHALGFYNSPNTELPFTPRLPDDIAREKYICGSFRGWIALLDDAPGIALHNPFTGAHFSLPVISNFPETLLGSTLKKSDRGFAYYNRDGSISRSWLVEPFAIYQTHLANKIVCSSDPSDPDCVFMAICYGGECLIRCRPGYGNLWTTLAPVFDLMFFSDIIFYKGRFYAVSAHRVFVCDNWPGEQINEILPADPFFSDGQIRHLFRPQKSYLVVSSGNLLLAAFDSDNSFEVFRVDLEGGQMKILKMKNLDGRALFLGRNCMSVSASPGSNTWCKGNCIYYSYPDYRRQPGSDKLIMEYNVEDGSTRILTNNPWDVHWLTPSLCC